MNLVVPEDILYIDTKSSHEDEERSLTVHPAKMHLLNKFEKESFDKIIIVNSRNEYFTAMGMFNCFQLLKPNKFCEVYIDQPVVSMQKLDAEYIENLAKRGNFQDIKLKPFEKWTMINGKDIKIETLIVSMFKIPKKTV